MSRDISLKETMLCLRDLGLHEAYNPEYIHALVNEGADDDEFEGESMGAEVTEPEDCYLPINVELKSIAEFGVSRYDANERTRVEHSRYLLNDCVGLIVAKETGVFECCEFLYGGTNSTLVRIARKVGFMTLEDWVQGKTELISEDMPAPFDINKLSVDEALDMLDDADNEARGVFAEVMNTARYLYTNGHKTVAMMIMRKVCDELDVEWDSEIFTSYGQFKSSVIAYSRSESAKKVGLWLPYEEDDDDYDKPISESRLASFLRR